MVAGRCIVAEAWEVNALKHRIRGFTQSSRPRHLPPTCNPAVEMDEVGLTVPGQGSQTAKPSYGKVLPSAQA